MPNSEASPSQTQQDEHTSAYIHKAHALANEHAVVYLSSHLGESPKQVSLAQRVREYEKTLRDAYIQFGRAPQEQISLSYAAEWVLDNYYIIEQAIRQIREDLPSGYYRQLPLITVEPYKDLPRIYALVEEIVSSQPNALSLEQVEEFVNAYQEVQPLLMGELWALPIMFRIVLLKRLADLIKPISMRDPSTVKPGQPPDTPADGLAAGYCISGLRWVSVQDWLEFFESVSLVERILSEEPMGIYTRMDFNTRNQYRKAVEILSRAAHIDEQQIARTAVQLAEVQFNNGNRDSRKGHVGYYLIDDGLRALEVQSHYAPSMVNTIQRWLLDHPTFTYLAPILVLSLLIVFQVARTVLDLGGTPLQALLAAILSVVPASTAVISISNWTFTQLIPPRPLPRMNYEDGIPPECRTVVAIPMILSQADEMKQLAEQLELHYLRNSDPQLTFVLLNDFPDAPQKDMPGDAAIIEQAAGIIKALNAKYRTDHHSPFLLLHRERRWNPSEGVWMGWERKRGKLAELNCLINGCEENSFVVTVGDVDALRGVRYVITLDADTVMLRDNAAELIATISHPLNRAEFSADGRHVVAGYTILQPRTEILPTAVEQSWFTRIFAGDVGLDPYTHAVSDVYQDLFGEGIYVGKGIYDVAAFEKSLHGRVPENTLLSHDLFEGIHGRAGLVTDIVLLEDYPPHYPAHVLRQNRWMRGDWQLLPWLFPLVPHVDGSRDKTPLSWIDRWKIIDNLRRSLLAPTLLALFALAWLWLPGSALAWTVIASLSLGVPVLTNIVSIIFSSIIRRQPGVPLSINPRPALYGLLRWVLALVFLPYEALLAFDAIATTLVRLLIFHRHMLQWTTAAHVVRQYGAGLSAKVLYQHMLSALLVSMALLLGVAYIRPTHIGGTLFWVAVWLLSPQIAYLISRPLATITEHLTTSQQQWLRCVARRTWYYFEHFIGPEDHWLPPDHFQEFPLSSVAHHTSPTNIGMLLLSTLAAYDLGYVRRLDMTVRFQATFDTMARLERYRGHFLNWYDTRTLEPLPPAYVSMVDSGNLAASLIAMRQGCLTVQNDPVLRWERYEGLVDLLELLRDTVNKEQHDITEVHQALELQLQKMIQAVRSVAGHPELWYQTLTELNNTHKPELDQLILRMVELDQTDVYTLGDLRAWVERLTFHLSSMIDETDVMVPWQKALQSKPALFQDQRFQPSWNHLQDQLSPLVTMGDLATTCQNVRDAIAQLTFTLLQDGKMTPAFTQASQWCETLNKALSIAQSTVDGLLKNYHDLADQADQYVNEMDFAFLFDEQREVFHIGYNLTNSRLDPNYYDLLSSEARIGSLVAIAKGDAPVSHWLHLGRPFTNLEGQQVLLSWSGTMFEYLMPPLLLRSYPGTLLHQTCKAVIDEQIRYGKHHQVPWGISESGYYAFDSNQNYQYRAFGVPGLGYKRGLADDLVTAPYAAALAVQFKPVATVLNLEAMNRRRLLGRYGFYDAIDYTPARMPPGRYSAVVQSYLAHHQGMCLLAFTNLLRGNVMVERFHADPRVESIELLLQEKVPDHAPLERPHASEHLPSAVPPPITIASWEVPAESEWPQARLLSNGTLSTVLTSAGAGFTTLQQLALTRWNSDPTLEESGSWIYIQEQREGHWSPANTWSATQQPMGVGADEQHVAFWAHKASYRRRDRGISTQTEVTVTPNENADIRHITLTNHTNEERVLRITSYGEVVLAPLATDQRHPAFSKLFIESEYVSEFNTLLFHRRPRSATENPIYLMHCLVSATPISHQEPVRAESSRDRFIGRGHGLRNPAALYRQTDWLTGTVGATLDPIMSLGLQVKIPPHEQVQLAFLTAAGNSRAELINLARRYSAWPAIVQAFDQSRAQTDMDLRRHGFGTPELSNYDRVLSTLLYPNASLRAASDVLATNTKGQSGLWPFGISGDYPIILVRLKSEGAPIVTELLQAHKYWRDRQITANLVFLNERDTGYDQSLNNYLYRVLTATNNTNWLNRREGIFTLRADQLTESERILLQTAAVAVFDSQNGPLAEQLQQAQHPPDRLPGFIPTPTQEHALNPDTPVAAPEGIRHANGYGGFSSDGKEYVIHIPLATNGSSGELSLPPAPWSNVVANPQFGFLITEAGSGCTWSENSGENRLTPWNNDPVTDRTGEAIFLRDEETAEVWSPTPRPAGASMPYQVHYGAGYATFVHTSHHLQHKLHVFTPPDDPVKIMQLEVHNTTDLPRRVTATYYAEWVLGTLPDSMRHYIITEFDGESHTLLARNPYSSEFSQCVAFATANQNLHSLTADRTEFLGRQGNLSAPAAIRRVGLSGTVGAGWDPCAAIQIHIDLAPNETKQVHFVLGQGANRDDALRLARQYADAAFVQTAWQATQKHWEELLGVVQVKTPDETMDLMLNQWLLYQALACRIWGRTAYYQSSGAFGYRDQLQDVMSLVSAAPAVARAHILDAAKHQFEAGDVLHWWHPPSGRGIRSRCSDDLLWLPFVTSHYVDSTGDLGILDEKVPFLIGEPLRPGEEERYSLYESTSETYTLYEHCQRALHKGSTAGPHGLPLIGTGDWNDGMNRVGIGGRGESVWLGWFLNTTLKRFADVCERAGDAQLATIYRDQANALAHALSGNTWDGQWYRRAYYDDESPLGSSQNSECQIDSIAQSWSVISGAGENDRMRRAMQSTLDLLVRPNDQLVLLFTPPFDKTPKDPGYIRGYVPGIRENGGQYTHGAIWVAWAFAALGDGERAVTLFHMLNPVNHAENASKIQRYKVEPYIIAADIYSVTPHVGRGGWTWYTGSASWMYRLGTEAILGLQPAGDQLHINPHIPDQWPGFDVDYRVGAARYHIRVVNGAPSEGQSKVTLDGHPLPSALIPLKDDGKPHEVVVHLK